MNIAAVGGTTQDIFILYEPIKIVHENNCVYIALAEGCKIEVEKVLYSTGGGACNSAASFTALGSTTSIISKIGNDSVADFIVNNLHTKQIITDLLISSPDAQTGISFIIPSPSKDRAILTLRGANANITSKDIPYQKLSTFDLLYITSMTGVSSETLLPLTKYAHEHTIPVAHNPGSSQLAHGADNLKQALPYINTLILNSDEAALLNKSVNSQPTKQTVEPIKGKQTIPRMLTDQFINHCFDLRTFCKSIINHGPKIVVVTDGAHGVYVAHTNKLYYHPTIKIKEINTIGAGDAFGSTFVAHIAQGNSIEQALLSGIINAVSVISYMDTTTGLLTKEQIQTHYDQIGLDGLLIFEL